MIEEAKPRRPVFHRRWPLWVAAVALLSLAWGFRRFQEAKLYGGRANEGSGVDETPAVKAYRIRPRDVAGALKRIGTVRAAAETNLQFGAAGRIARFDVERGQFVKRGALVAALDQDEAQNALTAVEMEYQKAAAKYFKDRTIDRLEYQRVKARYNQARLDMEKTVIRAPHDGYLVEKWANAGERVEAGAAVGKLMDKSRVFVEMELSEDDIQHLKKGQKVEITVDAVPDFRSPGEVAAITPYLKGDSRSFQVRVNVPENPREALSPGMFARCTVRRYEKQGALTVPLEAGAELSGGHMKVYTLDDRNQVRLKTLNVLFLEEDWVEVDGLAAGDLVILRPGAELQDGAKVRVMDVFDPAASQGPAAPPEASGDRATGQT